MKNPLNKKMEPVHPGEILLEDFLTPLGVTQYRLAKVINVPPRRINEIVHGTRGITADTALRLAKFFGTTTNFWLNLQNHYDVEVARYDLEAILERIETIQTFNSSRRTSALEMAMSTTI